MDIWHRVGRIVRFSNLGTLLFFTLNILLIVAVALKQIDCTPDAKTCAQSDNESLKNGYCAIEKCHNIFLLKFEIVLRIEKALRTTGIKTGRKA